MRMLCLFLILALAPQPIAPGGDAPLNWGPTVHQVVVVKATSLMPPPLRNQILRHREQILGGCLDVLREERESAPDAGEIVKLVGSIKRDLTTKVPYSDICYKLGRLSALVVEYASPLTGSNLHKAGLFRDLIRKESVNFPLVISREGEGNMRRGSLSGYLDYCRERNAKRHLLLENIFAADGGPHDWSNQRSLAYGLASLLYNELVLDSARVWLLLWQDAGGDISLAPYFRLPAAEGGR